MKRLRRMRRFKRRRVFKRKRLIPTIKRVMKKEMETKQVNFQFSQTNSTLSYVALAPNVPQGPGDNQRIGTRIQTKNYMADLTLFYGNGSTSTTNLVNCRIYVAYPRELSGSDAVTQITPANFPVFNRHDEDNWVIWKMWDFCLGPLNTANDNGITYRKKIRYFKKWNAHHQFKSAAVGDVVKTPFMIFANDSNALTGVANMTGYTRMAYIDA